MVKKRQSLREQFQIEMPSFMWCNNNGEPVMNYMLWLEAKIIQQTMIMKKWGTEIFAKCPITGDFKTYCGPNIKAPTKQLAFEWCQNNGLGYLHITDEVIAEIDAKTGDINDFETTQNN